MLVGGRFPLRPPLKRHLCFRIHPWPHKARDTIAAIAYCCDLPQTPNGRAGYASAVRFRVWCGMQYSATVESHFEAGHWIEGHKTCGRMGHGHHYRVQVTAYGHMARDGSPVDMTTLRESVQALSDECDGRYLNDMLPGVIPTPHGIGRWYMERLLDQWPRVVEVTVWERPCCSGTVRRDDI